MMESEKKVSASIPASLSFIFKPLIEQNLWQKKRPFEAYTDSGSIGIGCTINRPITVIATEFKQNRILFNGISCRLPTVSTALKYLTAKPVGINIDSSLPLGWGFGISGA